MPNIFITGANRGLGLLLALGAAKRGFTLHVSGRTLPALRQPYIDKDIDLGGALIFDMAASPANVIAEQLATLPRLDAVIHCASPYSRSTLLEASAEELSMY